MPQPQGLPAPIRSDVPGSYPRSVLHDRHPAILRTVADALPYPPHIRAALDRLGAQTATGTIQPLPPDAHDGADWAAWSRDHLGHGWYEVPFLWAESYFYRRLLDAVDYFRPGPWWSVDPFEPQKRAELDDPTLDGELDALADLVELPADQQLTAALDAALWGNRADLGFRMSDPGSQHREHSADLVADDTATLRDLLHDGSRPTVHLVADNSGRELVPDLVLIDVLLRTGLARDVELHLKPQPHFISDATGPDLLACLRRLAGSGAAAIGERLRRAMGDGRLRVSAHPFYCSPLDYRELPDDLAGRFAAGRVTILKGDLNYRRLVGDRHWPPTTPFARTVDYFPGPVATLRTLKSDVVVGLTADDVARLDTASPGWRVSGTHGLVQTSP